MLRKLTLFALVCMVITLNGQKSIDRFVNNPLHRTANISVEVKDLAANKVVASHRSGNATITASTMKLITTATALEILGADYRFETTLEVDGEITPTGVLNGNLYIRGSGDPTLGSSKIGNKNFLSDWVDAVMKAGIKQINGDVIADNTAFDTEGVNPKWMWEDMGNYFAAGAYGIAYKDNSYELTLNSKAVGTTPEIVKVTPNIPELTFKNYLKSTNIRFDSAYIYGAPYEYSRSIYGEIPANRTGFVIKGDIPRPGLVLARDFAWKLKSSGITVTGKGTDEVQPGSRTAIFIHQSPPLREIIREINVTSNNLYAEHLFRHLSLRSDKLASTNASIQLINNFWKEKGLPVEELFMCDGSGLSPANAVSAHFFVSLLAYMNSSKNSPVFRASLPIAGTNGTLRNFLSNTLLSGKVQAKSGTISRVRSYAGYINADGRQLAFAVLVNNPNAASTSPTAKMIEELLLNIVKEGN